MEELLRKEEEVKWSKKTTTGGAKRDLPIECILGSIHCIVNDLWDPTRKGNDEWKPRNGFSKEEYSNGEEEVSVDTTVDESETSKTSVGILRSRSPNFQSISNLEEGI